MSKMTWIIVLVVVGIALAVVVGVLGTRNEPSTSSSSSSYGRSDHRVERARLGGHRRPERNVGQRRGVVRQDRRRGRRHGCEVDGVAALGLHAVLTHE